MPGRTNAGGGISPFAFIFVTYPAGSVCTCTDGSRTLKLKDTSGYGVFYPPHVGMWTVTITDPTGTKKPTSQSYEVAKEGQLINAELRFLLWLYKNGDEFSDITGGWDASTILFSTNYSYAAPIITKGETAMTIQSSATKTRSASIAPKNALDLSGYTTIHFNATAVDSSMRAAVALMGEGEQYINTSSPAYINDFAAGEYAIDISAVDFAKPYLIAINVTTGSTSGRGLITVDAVWLT